MIDALTSMFGVPERSARFSAARAADAVVAGAAIANPAPNATAVLCHMTHSPDPRRPIIAA